jgi:type I protein arginine methyltransferase
MYSVAGYGKMVADAPRMEAYVGALRQAVKSGSVVVDLGSGPGLFALLACQMGARRVYAIEPDNVIEVARQAAIANGYQERLICIQDYSTRVTLPERADVIVSDLRGVLPWYQHHLPSMADARRRLLKPDGILIPGRDIVWAALADAPEQYSDIVGPWEDTRYGIDLSYARQYVTNTWRKLRVNSEQLLPPPVQWCVVDYSRLESPDMVGEISWTIAKASTAHGLAIWFDSELINGIGFSNHPANNELIYGNAFFPFTKPIHFAAGDNVRVKLRARLIGEDYVWTWDTRVFSQGETTKTKEEFQQSTFFGVPLSIKQLHKRSADFVPTLNDDGETTAKVLGLMNGRTSLQEIADCLARTFPKRYPSSELAFAKAAELSLKYGNE